MRCLQHWKKESKGTIHKAHTEFRPGARLCCRRHCCEGHELPSQHKFEKSPKGIIQFNYSKRYCISEKNEYVVFALKNDHTQVSQSNTFMIEKKQESIGP